MNIARWVNSEPIILGILGIIIAGLITRKLITNIEKGNINSKTSKNVLITVIFIIGTIVILQIIGLILICGFGMFPHPD
ncbi:MAG TPA: hypothetical protein PK875_00815 [Spirochaetota bacterium]|mgnify:CR=1 FL=1|nr:hypothetical protein [Spirochaetota bacterium]